MTLKEARSATELSPKRLEPSWLKFVSMAKSKQGQGKVLAKDFPWLGEIQEREKVILKKHYPTDICGY